MARYKPTTPYNVPMIILPPQYLKVKGTEKKTYPSPNLQEPGDALFYGSFRTFGGTDMTENNLYSVVDTATIETWYRPDITSECAIYVIDSGKTYQIEGSPENIQMRNQFLRIKVRCISGGA